MEESISSPFDERELWALQEMADRYGPRWRTILFAAYEQGKLEKPLADLLKRPHAGNEIARLVLLPRSLSPVALYYGALFGP